ncbi:uncharacterized protein FRV6_15346 [Fusarium oxysporum]|uniref:BZIP domain-containing protein n=1 Tax=Fusarium oxysporum TaxID=5507 RepID=A0A2H3TRF1_FUSOX|nr:uncharacterized protein FRV6_15346 [Fusarium oxysporum]
MPRREISEKRRLQNRAAQKRYREKHRNKQPQDIRVPGEKGQKSRHAENSSSTKMNASTTNSCAISSSSSLSPPPYPTPSNGLAAGSGMSPIPENVTGLEESLAYGGPPTWTDPTNGLCNFHWWPESGTDQPSWLSQSTGWAEPFTIQDWSGLTIDSGDQHSFGLQPKCPHCSQNKQNASAKDAYVPQTETFPMYPSIDLDNLLNH